MSALRHDKIGDIALLSGMVDAIPANTQITFAAAILGRGLMRGPWWLHGLVWSVRSIRGWTKTTTWHLFLTRFQRGMAEQIIREFSRHILLGKDTSDARSIGGLNQREIDDTTALLRNCLCDVEIHPTYRAALGTSPTNATGVDVEPKSALGSDHDRSRSPSTVSRINAEHGEDRGGRSGPMARDSLSRAGEASCDSLPVNLPSSPDLTPTPGEPDCPACGGSGCMGPYFPGGLSTICANCTPTIAKGVSE